MEGIDNETYATNANGTLSPEMIEAIRKEQERVEFYATYDVMTGVRIAATLGGFFGLMVLLVVYKSKSKTERALENPAVAAAAVAEAEEEERQIAAALEANAYEQLHPGAAAVAAANAARRSRRSIDTAASVSPRWIRSTKRFSIAGYASLMEPPLRLSGRLAACSSIDEDSPPDDMGRMLYDDIYACYDSHLGVPNRRPSNVTCSSSGSSYLERRGSSMILGLPTTAPAHRNHHQQQHHQHLQQMRRRQSSPLPEQYDFYYPIDIRVIHPTPGGSPAGSERALYDRPPAIIPTATASGCCAARQHLMARRAPLASISSCNSSLANDYPDLEMQSHASYRSDSVFHDIEYYEDTDDEVDPFSTDSEEEDDEEEDDEAIAMARHRLDKIAEDVADDDQPCCSQQQQQQRRPVMSPLSTISDESTSTLIGVVAGPGVHYMDEEEDDEEEVSACVRTSASGHQQHYERGMSTSATLGALGTTLGQLERKRAGSCCSSTTEGSPSPTSMMMMVTVPKQEQHGGDSAASSSSSIAVIEESREQLTAVGDVPQIEIIDVDEEVGDETGVWSKETLF